MVCSLCGSKSVFNDLCKDHFFEYFEDKVSNTISEFGLLNPEDKVCVAVSGGKDSVVLLFVLKKLGFDVHGLAIDEGIAGYRAETLDFLKLFCSDLDVPLVVESFKKETGKDLDEMVHSGPACNACGTFRRFLLNKHSSGFDKIATGHNLDDESQAVLMNLFKAQSELFNRQGPISRVAVGFTQKVKPLYFLKEKEIMAYAFLKGFDVPMSECPYARLSFRSKVRDFINKEEARSQGVKENIIRRFLELRRVDDSVLSLAKCEKCGFPSEASICKACRLKESF